MASKLLRKAKDLVLNILSLAVLAGFVICCGQEPDFVTMQGVEIYNESDHGYSSEEIEVVIEETLSACIGRRSDLEGLSIWFYADPRQAEGRHDAYGKYNAAFNTIEIYAWTNALPLTALSHELAHKIIDEQSFFSTGDGKHSNKFYWDEEEGCVQRAIQNSAHYIIMTDAQE
jgi:hypothetical protein